MDRRTFSRLATGACVAPLGALTACGGGVEPEAAATDSASRSALAAAAGSSATVYKWRATPNPTGLRIGFWENYGKQSVTLGTMGRRPSARVGFDDWSKIETSAGVYAWLDNDHYGDTHDYGESVLAAVNIAFRVPSFYAVDADGDGFPDITNDQVKVPALKFLRAYVRRLLKKYGSAVLTIDYEIISNYQLYKDDSKDRAAAWGAWYLEAAAAARDEAGKMGMSSLLKLQPIVNGNPLDKTNPLNAGGAGNPWLLSVVQASDFLALDTYFCDRDHPTDPARTIDIIDFWRGQFSLGKPVVVTEHGFSTIDSDGKDGEQPDPNKYHGTRQQQADYFGQLFPLLLAANLSTGRFANQLRGFHIWSITDNTLADKAAAKYYGLCEADGKVAKPAAAVVRQALDQIEGTQLVDGDPFHRPSNRVSTGGDLAAQLKNGLAPVDVAFNEGDDFEFLRYSDSGPSGVTQALLKVTLADAGNLLVCVNGHWLIELDSRNFSIDISAHYAFGGGSNVIDVHATASAFPVRQQVQSLRIAYT